MTDEILYFILAVIALCIVVYCMMRNGDYEVQRILPPGQYVAGKDIPMGRCDLIAESGGGNFVVKNKHAKTWNLCSPLGVTSGAMPGRFRNLTLNQGDVLEINGNLTVLLNPPVPILRLKDEVLGPGIYRFGVDIKPARYDIKVEGGDGEIYKVDITDNSYNLFQGMASGSALKASNYKNLFCSRRYELWICGSLQVKLKRSKIQPLLMFFRKDY